MDINKKENNENRGKKQCRIKRKNNIIIYKKKLKAKNLKKKEIRI